MRSLRLHRLEVAQAQAILQNCGMQFLPRADERRRADEVDPGVCLRRRNADVSDCNHFSYMRSSPSSHILSIDESLSSSDFPFAIGVALDLASSVRARYFSTSSIVTLASDMEHLILPKFGRGNIAEFEQSGPALLSD